MLMPLLPDEELIKIAAQSPTWDMDFRTDMLEKQIGKSAYKKPAYNSFAIGQGFDEQEFEPKRDLIKSMLSKKDYYIFLASLMYSREISNDIQIQNNGDVDLKNLKITISSPRSIITESREDNILFHTFKSALRHEVVKTNDSLTLTFPFLKKNDKTLSLVIVTRENPIENKDITQTYESNTFIIEKQIYIFLVVVFIIAFFLKAVIFRIKSIEQN